MATDHTIVTRLIELSRENRDLVAELEKFRRYITIMFTDIRGSTAYFEKFGDVAGLIMVHECNNALRGIVKKHGGRVHKTIGDAIMASFADCKKSVHAAVAMQEQLAEMNASKTEEHKTLVRIGLHYGTGVVKSDDVFGDVVNVASRVESIARPQQILISDSLQEQVLNGGFKIVPLGLVQLRGKEAEQALFEVLWSERPEHTAVAQAEMRGSTVVRSGKLRLQHLGPNGRFDSELEMTDRLTVGRTEGDLTFPSDQVMAPLNLAVSLENGHVFVENLSREAAVFVRLISVWMLKDRDVIMMGNQLFEFQETPEAMSLGAAMGVTVSDMMSLLHAPVAQFVAISPDRSVGACYPLTAEEVTFGRERATYTFPDDRRLSQAHSRVYQRGENFFLEDIGSRNGTFLKVRGRMPVPAGSTILVGQQLLRVSE